MNVRTPVLLLVTALLVAGVASAAPDASADGPGVTHGVVVGDVTSSSVVLWARADRAAALDIRLSGGPYGRVASVAVDADHDYTGHALLTGLAPATI